MGDNQVGDEGFLFPARLGPPALDPALLEQFQHVDVLVRFDDHVSLCGQSLAETDEFGGKALIGIDGVAAEAVEGEELPALGGRGERGRT